MSTARGIFDNFPNQPTPPLDSPFAIAPENAEPIVSPFAAVSRPESPFTVVDESTESRLVEPGRPARLPERRKTESPFQSAEVDEGFGFEAQAKAYHAAAFSFPGGPPPMGASPFSIEQPMPGQMPMAGYPGWPGNPQHGYSQAPQGYAPAPQSFAHPQQGFAPPSAPQGYPAYAPQAFAPVQAAPAVAVQVPTSFAPANPPSAPAPAHSPSPSYSAPTPGQQSDSFSIRQLELRAIFGVDREMSEDEILKRSRVLPGIRNLARLQEQDLGTIESLKQLVTNLGFGGGELKLYSGSTPMDFIREGNVILAAQTDGGFAPGVKEILMLVARELGRMSS